MKDYEASVELLEDRKKEQITTFSVTLFFGAIYLICGLVISYVYVGAGIVICCGGIAIFVFADMLHRNIIRYANYIFMIKKGVIHAAEKRE